MVRKLKYHEQKLLKKVDFITWKSDKEHRELKIIRKYHLQKREDYTRFEIGILYILVGVASVIDYCKKLDFVLYIIPLGTFRRTKIINI